MALTRSLLFWRRIGPAALIAPLLLASCGGSADETRTELRVADQFGRIGTVLTAAGEDKPTAYRLNWSNFVGGPAIIAAQTGGSVDLGWMAETPLIFAQAAGSPVKVVAVSRPVGGSDSGRYSLVVGKRSAIRTPADLKGKKVAFMPGTVVQYVLVQLLEANGLTLKDIKPVTTNGSGGLGGADVLLDSGQIDAIILADPIWASLEQAGKVRVVATSAPPLKSGFGFLVVPTKLLEDKVAEPLLKDFIQRVARSAQWQIDNPAPAATALAKSYRVPEALGPTLLKRALIRWVPIDGAIIAEQQAEADSFHRLGLIRQKIDVRQTFDTRFNAIVADAGKKEPGQ